MTILRKAQPGRLARNAAFAAALAGLLGAAAACSSSSSPAAQTSANAQQTIVFATHGLGGEGTATNSAIAGFEKQYPNIKVQVFNLDASATNQLTQLDQRFQAGTGLDVVDGDVTWTSQFAAAGYIRNLSSDAIDKTQYFAAQLASAEYNGALYAVPWFVNAEGVYYRTDLVKTPPTSAAQLVSDAQRAALRTDTSLQGGLRLGG